MLSCVLYKLTSFSSPGTVPLVRFFFLSSAKEEGGERIRKARGEVIEEKLEGREIEDVCGGRVSVASGLLGQLLP